MDDCVIARLGAVATGEGSRQERAARAADLQPDERDHLLALLGRLRPLDPGRPGVHPGLTDTPGDTQNAASKAES